MRNVKRQLEFGTSLPAFQEQIRQVNPGNEILYIYSPSRSRKIYVTVTVYLYFRFVCMKTGNIYIPYTTSPTYMHEEYMDKRKYIQRQTNGFKCIQLNASQKCMFRVKYI